MAARLIVPIQSLADYIIGSNRPSSAKMAFLWGTAVLISVVFNTYLSIPPIINMILLDRGFDSIVQAINGGDIALIASLMNALLAIALLMRAIIVSLRWISGKQGGKQNRRMNGHGSTHAETPPSGPGAFVILCIGLAGGYIASNTLLVNRHVSSSTTLHEKYNLALEEAASAQRMLSSAHEGAEQCRAESADVLSEMNGKLAARDATIDTYNRAAADAGSLRSELDKVSAQLKEAQSKIHHASSQDVATKAELESKTKLISYLKSEMTAMGERFGIKIGEVENSVFEAQENRRRTAVEKSKLEKELQEVQPELARLKRSQEGLEKKLKKEADSHATTMDEYSRTVVQLGDLENAVIKFLKGEGSKDELRKLMGSKR